MSEASIVFSPDPLASAEESQVWMILIAGTLFITAALAVCVCCKKPKGFAEFRSSTQLNDFSQSQLGEVTLFPPPSLSLSREDLDVSFEPLPKPQLQSSSNRSKEILEWIGNNSSDFKELFFKKLIIGHFLIQKTVTVSFREVIFNIYEKLDVAILAR